MNLFRVGGIQLAVHFSFLLLLAVNAFDGWAEAGWPGLWWNSAPGGVLCLRGPA
jgi:hypothetical protein